MSRNYQDELHFLGSAVSPSFSRESEGDGVIERFWRSLNEQFLRGRILRNVKQPQLALRDFRDFYDRSWILQKHSYRTPSEVRSKLTSRQDVAT